MPLAQELARHFVRDLPGWHRLVAHAPTGRASRVDTPTGSVVAVEGRKLHSGRDPEREARRFVRDQDVAQTTVVVLLGLGSGHVVRALARQTEALLVVFEPDLDVLWEGLQHGPLPPETLLVTDVERLGATLYELLDAADRGKILPWQPSLRLQPTIYAQAARQTHLAVERARIRALTTQVRVEGWLEFYLQNLPRLIEGPTVDAFAGAMRGVPAVICSAGPSLNKQLQALRHIQDDAVILVVNTAARALAKAGVTPTAVVSVESLDVTCQFEGIPWVEEVPAFLELTGSPKMFEAPFARRLPISVDTSACSLFTRKVIPDSRLSGGFCVANTAFALAHRMGCDPIVLVGQDLAFKDGQVYAKGTLFEDVRAEREGDHAVLKDVDSKRKIEAASAGTLRSGVHQGLRAKADVVPAWGGEGEVETNRDFMMFRDWFAFAALRAKDEGHTLINATEGGAHVPNWDHLPFAQFVEQFIERHVRHAGDDGPTVRQRFNAAAARPGTDPAALRTAVDDELEHVKVMLEVAARCRALVGDDPDGDVHAEQSVAMELAQLQQELRNRMGRAPLAAETLTAPVEALRERQELSTYSLARATEQHLGRLRGRLEAVRDALDALAGAAA